ncbi:MAG: inorganic phosphate transporter, PiT family [uncultured Candidatus Poseidoniales archaeon]|nr:MAG: inorganic phosphate transporter, PiT family [uncultured Candidatus Poseidoniales archaeon]
MAWNIGANDVANAMGTSVGSRALTLKQAVIIAAVFEFCGAFFAGDAVTDTVRKGILTVDFSDGTVDAVLSQDIAFGFIAAMMAAATWLTIATRMGLPVSTTHSIIGGILGVGLILEVKHDTSLIDWEVVQKVVMSWVASPVMGGLLGFFSFMIIKKLILENENPIDRSRWLAPVLAFPTFFVLGLALQFKALKGFISRAASEGWIENKYDWLPVKEDGVFDPWASNAWIPINSIMLAAFIGAVSSLVLYLVLRRIDITEEKRGFRGVERIFVWLQIITAAYVAFAHGANDRSNAIGPMAAVWQVLSSDTGELAAKADIPLWLILLGSAGIAIGVMTWGWRVMETIGKKITDITPTRGFAAEFGAATTILVFSMPFLAVPVSTTHTLVGAVVGVGLAGGAKAVDFRVFGKIAASWVASVPAAAFGAIVLFVASGGESLNMIVLLPLSFMAVGYAIWKSSGEVHVEDALSDVGGNGHSVTPFELFHEHAQAVEKTVEHMLDAVNTACDGEDASEAIQATIEAELVADNVKTEVRRLALNDMRMGVQLSLDDFLYMVTRQDRIADYAQNVAEQLAFRPLFDDDQAKANLKEMAKAVSETVAKYEDAVEALRDFTISGQTKAAEIKLAELIKEVNLKEHEADGVEAMAAAYVFTNGEDAPLAAMHMYRVLQRLDDVANACEKAANAFLPILNS